MLIVYDITNEDSFHHLPEWIEEAKQFSRPDASFMLLGNKKDLSINGERVIQYLDASKFAQENECLLFETSAMTGENVENAFYKLVQTVKNRIENGQVDDGDQSIRKYVQNITNSSARKSLEVESNSFGGCGC